jgi:hypothetical protein
MTRLWPEGIPIVVSLNHSGTPGELAWQGQPHSIHEIAKQWRVQGEWWRNSHARDYFKVVTTTGLLLIIYRDLQTNHWYLQRLYD